ncbi:MAG: UbiX family flavin prenyltransferase [Oscillospiraceae bacterium]
MAEKRLIVGVSGASGAPIALSLLKALSDTDIETHLIITRGGEETIRRECGMTPESFASLADFSYQSQDIGAAPASGTWKNLGMVVVPCSMRTLAGIHSGYSENLLLRAADVTLKERRKLILVPRECPFGTIHLRNMYELSQIGAVVLPPVLSFYNSPESIGDEVHHIIGKIFDQLGLELPNYRRWLG